MSKIKKTHFKDLSDREWAIRLKNSPRSVLRFKTAGELALMASLRPGAKLKQIHGTLQLLRHWWLSKDFDLVDKRTVMFRLRKLGAGLEDVLGPRDGRERTEEIEPHGTNIIAYGGKGRNRPKLYRDGGYNEGRY